MVSHYETNCLNREKAGDEFRTLPKYNFWLNEISKLRYDSIELTSKNNWHHSCEPILWSISLCCGSIPSHRFVVNILRTCSKSFKCHSKTTTKNNIVIEKCSTRCQRIGIRRHHRSLHQTYAPHSHFTETFVVILLQPKSIIILFSFILERCSVVVIVVCVLVSF